ncbi:MAG: hypothetical protein QM724_11810 [Flavobacteriales bacterium]
MLIPRMVPSLLLVLLASGSIAQARPVQAEQDSIRLSVLFPMRVNEYEGRLLLDMEPDSMRGDARHEARCSALWPYHTYLLNNYCNAYLHTGELTALLPDTPRVRARYDELLQADSAFQQVMAPTLRGTTIPALPIDSALSIAAHFYYVHRVGDKVTTHVCSGINKVKELGTSVADAHYAAFAYMAIYDMGDMYAPFYPVVQPYREEMRANLSDERLHEVEQRVYAGMAGSAQLREALIAEYQRKKAFLPFELVW